MKKLMAAMLVIMGLLLFRYAVPEYFDVLKNVRESQEKYAKLEEAAHERLGTALWKRYREAMVAERKAKPNYVYFENGVTGDHNKLEIKEVNKPIFGIYLGEPFKKLAERALKEFEWNLYFGRDKAPNTEDVLDLATLPRKDGSLCIFTCAPREERVVSLTMYFKDTHLDRYNEIKGTLQRMYPGVKWTSEERTEAHWEFKGFVNVDGVDVFIQLQRKVSGTDTDLRLSYFHWPLYTKTWDEIEHRRSKRLSDNL